MFLLERRKPAFAVVIIIGFTCYFVIDMMVVFPWQAPVPPKHEFTWAVSEGNEFVFNVTGESMCDPTDMGSQMPSEYIHVINTTIIARVVALPDCSVSSEEDFLSVVDTIKVNCYFANGSELPPETKSALDLLISRLILPTQGWDYISWLFVDIITDSHDLVNTYYRSYIEEDSCYFGHYTDYIDARYYWQGVLSTITGVPSLITTGYAYYGSPGYSWNLRLDLIE